MSRLRPRRISRSCGATLALKKSGPTPIAAAASAGVRAIRGMDTGSFFTAPTPRTRGRAALRIERLPRRSTVPALADPVHRLIRCLRFAEDRRIGAAIPELVQKADVDRHV